MFGTLCAIDPAAQSEALIEDRALIETLARLLSTILQSEMRAQRLSELADGLLDAAYRDVLTGTLNRRGWDRLVNRAQDNTTAFGTRHGVVIVDLDGLKTINDSQGHAAGDAHLQRAAQALVDSTRGADIVARIGGDEFGILLEDPDGPDVGPYVERLGEDLQRVGVSASIGWATAGTGTAVLDAVAEADRRMYENKRVRKSLGR
jgi:diguanylate cyclase (GGDEF)-like protein